MKKIQPIVWIFVAMFIFAFGFIGYNLYQQHQIDVVRNQPPPVLPALK